MQMEQRAATYLWKSTNDTQRQFLFTGAQDSDLALWLIDKVQVQTTMHTW